MHSYSHLEVAIWKDLIPDVGPLGGIYTALSNSRTDRTLIIAGDMPFLTKEFLQYVVHLQKDADIVIPHSTDGYQPLTFDHLEVSRDTPMEPEIDIELQR